MQGRAGLQVVKLRASDWRKGFVSLIKVSKNAVWMKLDKYR